MCGITGFLGSENQETLQKMTTALQHRGPDSAGYWMGDGVALGHRRLAIIDLSPSGEQPMQVGRYVISFNGEIYNFPDLRRELEGRAVNFRGTSDTEVLLAGMECWGIKGALQRTVGMFALAVWDLQTQALTLARDRLGEKPLYYAWGQGAFLFGSELKALRQHPKWVGRLNHEAVGLLMRYGYIPAPYSIYEDVYKLPPAHLLCLKHPQERPEPEPYWSLQAVAEAGLQNPFQGDAAEATQQLDALLRQAVKQQMISDVPLGAFLSGGVDSSLIVALMQAQSSQPVQTFSIGFTASSYNEAPYAKAVAQHLGTDHTELILTPADAKAIVPQLPTLYDEPFADSSQIPTFLVSRLARQSVTVSLSGDGGDELFAGYDRYIEGQAIWAWRSMPLAPQLLRLAAQLSETLPRNGRNPVRKLNKWAAMLAAPTAEAFYRAMITQWRDAIVLGAEPPNLPSYPLNTDEVICQMSHMDVAQYLPDDILVKVDRASMAVGLEARVPLLNHHVVEFAYRLPLALKVQPEGRKWILRQVLDQYVPKELIERPKMGFSIPLGSWLRDDLSEWAEALLDEKRLQQEGIFDVQAVRKHWIEHRDGVRSWEYALWPVLMFQAWHAHHF